MLQCKVTQANMKPITRDELHFMKKREDDRRYWEGIQKAVETIYDNVQKYAKRGLTLYIYPSGHLKESACDIIRGRVADLFPGTSVTHVAELDTQKYREYENIYLNFPGRFDGSNGRFIDAILVDWA
jgi:hypothetical protein